jgi:hypothetical protein
VGIQLQILLILQLKILFYNYFNFTIKGIILQFIYYGLPTANNCNITIKNIILQLL